jgi:menaquinone-specific isochorismate synthase
VSLDPAAAAALLDLLPPDPVSSRPVTWLRRGQGLVGWGVAAEVRTSGPTRFADAAKWWSETVARAEVHDAVQEPGTGLVSFGSFAFADEPGDSVLVVPAVVVGRRGDSAWLTTVGVEADVRGPQAAPAPPAGVRFADGALNGEQWMSVVADAVARIEAGDLEKVVLARDLIATATEPIDVRWPLRRLAADYPMCWTFHVDGLFGATPEMLVRRERGLVTSRVLAGTIRRTGDDERDLALAATLARSSKDLEEHEYAVRSVADALEPHCSSMNVPEAPFVLHLPNVMHLATDVNGVVHDATTVSSLQLAEALHPSAAVGGTPTPVATALIAEIEGMDRGRYAGPVGWMDASGDGEWGIALRSASVEGTTVRLYAGCGIVGDSDPAAELAEAQAKFVPVRDALAP